MSAGNVTIREGQFQHRVYKYRLYPTRAQETALNATLNATLEILRGVYNSLLHEREFLYYTTGKGIGQFAQEKHFTLWSRSGSKIIPNSKRFTPTCSRPWPCASAWPSTPSSAG